MKKETSILNEDKLRKIVKKQLSEIIDRDYFNGFVYGYSMRKKIFNESKFLIEKKYGKQINENSKFIREVNELAEKKISIAVQKINEGKINEFVPAVLGAAALDTAAGGIGQGEGSYGQNLKKYVNNRRTNRQNYIQNGEIVGYDNNGQPIYNNKGSRFWRGVKSGLATSAPWIGSALGTIAGSGIGSAALGTAGYFAGNKLGKNYNGSTQIMSKELRQQMQNDANNFKIAYQNREPYISPFISKGVNNPGIDMEKYNELNGIDSENIETEKMPDEDIAELNTETEHVPGERADFADDPNETRRFQTFAKNELRTYAGNIDGIWGPKTQLSWDIYNENEDARPADFANDSNEVRRFQLYAVDQGLYDGQPDGIWGPKTQRAWNQINTDKASAEISKNTPTLSYPTKQ